MTVLLGSRQYMCAESYFHANYDYKTKRAEEERVSLNLFLKNEKNELYLYLPINNKQVTAISEPHFDLILNHLRKTGEPLCIEYDKTLNRVSFPRIEATDRSATTMKEGLLWGADNAKKLYWNRVRIIQPVDADLKMDLDGVMFVTDDMGVYFKTLEFIGIDEYYFTEVNEQRLRVAALTDGMLLFETMFEKKK